MESAWAAALCGTELGKNWAAAFGLRHKVELTANISALWTLKGTKPDQSIRTNSISLF